MNSMCRQEVGRLFQKAAAVSTDLADLLLVWERQERNSPAGKKRCPKRAHERAHSQDIRKKQQQKKTYCASFLNTETCQSTIRHSCYNASVIDLCFTVNSPCVFDNKNNKIKSANYGTGSANEFLFSSVTRLLKKKRNQWQFE